MVLVTKKQKSAPTHHRKRQANHHKRTDDYHKPYWPYLPLLGIIGFGFLLNIVWTPLTQATVSRQSNSVLSFSTNTSIAALLAETNSQRVGNGDSSLSLNSQLSAAAQAKANDMAARNYWSHETPDGGQPWQFIANAGYAYTAAGENLAYGFDSSASTILGWMNSPGHRANLLNTAFKDVGFGIANSEDFQGHGQQTIVVAMYGSTAAAVATQTSTPAAPVPAAATTAPPAAQPEATTPTASNAPSVPAAQPKASGSGDFSVTAQVPEQPKRLARVELVSDTVPSWSIAAILSVVVVGSFWFLSRHLHALHRKVVHGEQFIVKHAALDIAVVSVVTLGVLLTRTAGFIN